MLKFIKKFHKSLVAKLIVLVGLVLLICLSGWAYFSVSYQKKKVMDSIISDADSLTSAIKMGTHYAMMHNLEPVRQPKGCFLGNNFCETG